LLHKDSFIPIENNRLDPKSLRPRHNIIQAIATVDIHVLNVLAAEEQQRHNGNKPKLGQIFPRLNKGRLIKRLTITSGLIVDPQFEMDFISIQAIRCLLQLHG